MTTNPAGFWRRFLAFWLDVQMLLLFWLPFFVILGKSTSIANTVANVLLLIIAYLAIVILWWVYEIFATYHFLGTLGKLFTGIGVVNAHQEHLTVKRLLFRTFIGRAFSSVMFGLGYFSIIKDPQKRAWHDKAVGSYVITKHPKLWILGLFLLFVITAVNYWVLITATREFLQSSAWKEMKESMTNEKPKQDEKTEIGADKKYYPEEFITDKTMYKQLENLYLLRAQGKNVQAIENGEEILKTAKTKEEKAATLRVLGEIASLSGDEAAGEKYYKEALEVYPDTAMAYYGLAQIYLRKGIRNNSETQKQQGIRYAETLVSMIPEDARSYEALGLVLFYSGRQEEGINATKKALMMLPENSGRYNQLTGYLKQMEDFRSQKSSPSLTPKLSPTPVDNQI